MPSVSDKQRRFMGAELARKRAGKSTKTDMSEEQLGEFAHAVKQHGSLNDIEFHEQAATCEVAFDKGTHPIHKGYAAVVYGTDETRPMDGTPISGGYPGDGPKWLTTANRDIGNGVHAGAPVDYFGPDTDYRAEEIDPDQYGRSYEPWPFKDFFKTGDKMSDRNLRLQEQDRYDEFATPGTVTDRVAASEAHGAVRHEGAGPERELKDNRAFESQRHYARANKDAPDYDAAIDGLDTKKGSNIR